MDYFEHKKKIPFDFNTENFVLKNIFQINVLLKGFVTWKSLKKIVIVLVTRLPPIVISRGLDLCLEQDLIGQNQ